ncbi:hypothetical protein AB6A40_007547 [Gnathostoma spinigerum]|uniref:Cell division cycle protein 27 homolog n=1 Tax=Gnathostoma spinigerum TaxID=75299 RepID=A0ABD6ELT6_9BILA
MIPPSFKVLTAPLSGGKVCWSHVFVDVVECFSALALAQIALCQYDSSAVLDRLETVPPGFISSACPRELSARAYLEKLDYSKAAEILEKLHRDYPYRMSGMEILSTALWHAQDARRLSVLAAELTEKARQSAVTWCVAGNCFSVQKQHETAIECLKRAVSLDNRFPYAYSLLGHELLDSDQLDGAGQAFRRALLLCPSDYRAWFGLGLMFFKREQFKLAQLHLSRAATINPRNSVLLCQLSVVEQSVHNNDVAIALLERALELSPENAACRFYRARLLYELHRYEECREELNELKLFAHDEAQVFFLLGKVHKKLGDTHLALLNFTWASEMDPHGEQGRSSLSERPYDDEPNSPTSS